MIRNQGPLFAITIAVVALLPLPLAQAQAQTRGYVPRHERIAASVLLNGPRSGVRTASRPDSQPLEQVGEDAFGAGVDLPPTPPGGFGGGRSPATMSLGVSTESRQLESPIRPDAMTGGNSSSGIVYGDPFSSPLGDECSGCDSPGCMGGPSCGAAMCEGGCTNDCGRGYLWIDTFSISVGAHGFTNMVNRGDSSSFGFREGFNWGSPWVFTPLGMNTQLGFAATQSSFNGSDSTTNHRAQYFVTAGFYKRNVCGWQGGFVVDYLHDDWYATIDLAQLRGELSHIAANGSSVGVLFATSVSSDDTTAVIRSQTIAESWDSHDVFAAFYKVQSNRHRLGQWRVFAGFTGDSDGIIGSDFKVPLGGTWSLEPEFTYLVPDEATGAGGHQQESWNVAMNLVWYPARARGTLNYGLLPLFDVAGNGTMITRRR